MQLLECVGCFGVRLSSEETRSGLLLKTNLLKTLTSFFELLACCNA